MSEKNPINIDEDNEAGYQIPVHERKVSTTPSDPNIKDLCDRIDRGMLIARAEFQRNYVWKDRPTLKSRLIESVLLKVPIPVIYTAEMEDGKEIVVDGQQRLLTFHDFLRKDGFSLKGLKILKNLNGKTYQTLPQKPVDLQYEIETYPIRVVKILKESHPIIKFDIFERLNRGSVKLNEQELRNCIYRGNFNDLLKELVKNKDFLRLQNLKEPHKRMIDVERILRFFAFCDKSEHNYKSPLKAFLNNYMDNKRNIPKREIEEKNRLFKKSVELCQQVFGDLAFRRWHAGLNKENPNGSQERTINEGIFDIQMYGFMEYDKRDIVGKAQFIKDAFIDMICSDKEVIDSIEKGTYDTNKVKLRIEKWFSILRKIVGYPSNDRRLYTFEEKKALFERKDGNICQICKNEIKFIDDVHVDHIKRYIEKGETVLGNGQITHRYCNLHKG